MVSLVGYTGFVGSNLAESFAFDGLYNSKNISEAFGTCPDVLYYAGVPAQKFIANKFPQQDMNIIKTAIENIKSINPKKLILISTVDVYQQPNGKDEGSPMDIDGLEPYGKNRLYLEEYVKASFEDYLIVRLPGLYGKNLKKNFIYDYINFIPTLLSTQKFDELVVKDSSLVYFYADQGNGFFKVKDGIDTQELKAIFERVGFSALNFTDSRGIYQFYNLQYLYKDIQIAIKNKIKVLNIATQPVEISYLYRALTGKTFENCIAKQPPIYDFRTKYSDIFGGSEGYIYSSEFIISDIKKFISEEI
ncbi:MAG: NAD-dependent epimerase/dehydratase family protein [Oscillospiraceae bacterium]